MKYLIIIPLFLITTALFAQKVTYKYDAAGNRTERVVLLQSQLKSSTESSVITSMDDIIAEHGIKIYPNPTKGQLSLEILNYADNLKGEVWLYDLTGKTIHHQKMGSSIMSFDLSGQPSGIYLMKIMLAGEIVTWKVIKE